MLYVELCDYMIIFKDFCFDMSLKHIVIVIGLYLYSSEQTRSGEIPPAAGLNCKTLNLACDKSVLLSRRWISLYRVTQPIRS